MSKQPLSYHLASFDFCLTTVNPLLAQVGLYFSIFGHYSGPACFYSSILIIIKKPELVISVLNVTILCMFQGTRWPIILVPQFVTNYSFPVFSHTTAISSKTLNYYIR